MGLNNSSEIMGKSRKVDCPDTVVYESKGGETALRKHTLSRKCMKGAGTSIIIISSNVISQEKQNV